MAKSSFKPARRITIAMVTFNAAQVVESALQSVIRGRSPAMEIVVIDGGSTDGTVEILQRYASHIDYWKSEPDRGIYDAMNKVLEVATGDWLLFIGADDQLLITADEAMKLLQRPQALYYGNVEILRTGELSGGRFSRYRMMQENICHQAIFYPRCVYRRKSYSVDVGHLADHLYNIELRGEGVPFVFIDRTISRFNDAGRSSGGDPAFEVIKLAAIRRSFGAPLFLIKRLRSALVSQLKRRHVTA